MWHARVSSPRATTTQVTQKLCEMWLLKEPPSLQIKPKWQLYLSCSKAKTMAGRRQPEPTAHREGTSGWVPTPGPLFFSPMWIVSWCVTLNISHPLPPSPYFSSCPGPRLVFLLGCVTIPRWCLGDILLAKTSAWHSMHGLAGTPQTSSE